MPRSQDPFSSVCLSGPHITQNKSYSSFDAETTSGPDYEFNWSVHSYNLDLDISDKFYLWLFEGGPSAQGNTSIKNSQSSGFFYISATPITTTSSSPLPSSAVPSRSLSAPIVQATPSGNSKATGEIPQNNSSAADGDLSVAAKASIGVGAGVAGLAILSATLLFAKYRSKKKKELVELRPAKCLNFGDPTLSSTSKTTLPTTIVARQPPSELLGNDDRPIAELG